MSRRKRPLSAEDKDLWGLVRKTVTPLKGRRLVDEELESWMEHVTAAEPAPPPAASAPLFPSTPVKPFLPAYVPPVSQKTPGAPVLDDITMKKLRKGKLEIDARIDLHGMTEHAAHDALLRFIKQARREDARIILVITGKGKAGEGVLAANRAALVCRSRVQAAGRRLAQGASGPWRRRRALCALAARGEGVRR